MHYKPLQLLSLIILIHDLSLKGQIHKKVFFTPQCQAILRSCNLRPLSLDSFQRVSSSLIIKILYLNIVRNNVTEKCIGTLAKTVRHVLKFEYTLFSWFDIKFSLGLDFPNLPYYIDGKLPLTQTKMYSS
jgi:hypothetical protein